MEQFIGTKIVQAEPACRLTFQKLGGPEMVVTVTEENVEANIEAAEESGIGLVRKQEGYKVRYEDGYESWSPKEVFEKAYRRTDGLSFGLAIEAAKMGKRIARKGWNGKGMWVFLAESEELHTAADLSSLEEDVEVGEFFCMKTAQGGIQPGWLASQADMLADDWMIVEG